MSESPRAGILILGVLAVTTLAGGALGWTIRQGTLAAMPAVAVGTPAAAQTAVSPALPSGPADPLPAGATAESH